MAGTIESPPDANGAAAHVPTSAAEAPAEAVAAAKPGGAVHQPQDANASAADPEVPQSLDADNISTATAVHWDDDFLRPRATPCSLNPASWGKRRLRIAACGCLSSSIICIVRLLIERPGIPSAYLIHSIVILIDLILIHVFTYTTWLSVAGELVAIVFATCFHLTAQKVFELLETTLIAALVSFHMIQSRNAHWDHEEELERDVVGMQLYIERKHGDDDDDFEDAGADQTMQQRRVSGLSSSGRKKMKEDTGDIDEERGMLAPRSDMTNVSSFATTLRSRTNGTSTEGTSWWNHFFDHFLDGSAGVLYTSFVGLIIDEVVNVDGSSKR